MAYSGPEAAKAKLWENGWLESLWKIWTTWPVTNAVSTQAEGRKTLLRLLNWAEPLPMKPGCWGKAVLDLQPLMSKSPPERKDVWGALSMRGKDNDGVDIRLEAKTSLMGGPEVLEGMLKIMDGPLEEGTPFGSLLNVVSPELQARGLKPPTHIDVDGSDVVCHHVENGKEPKWESAVTPLGCITSCHVDETIISIQNAHIYGSKLWLNWPPTAENIRKYAARILRSTAPIRLSEGLDLFDGLELLWLESKDQLTWTMPPGTIHGVMSFSNGVVHTGFYFAWEAHLDIGKTCLDALMTVIEEDEDEGESDGRIEAERWIVALEKFGLPLWWEMATKLDQDGEFQRAGKVREQVLSWVKRAGEVARKRDRWHLWHTGSKVHKWNGNSFPIGKKAATTTTKRKKRKS